MTLPSDPTTPGLSELIERVERALQPFADYAVYCRNRRPDRQEKMSIISYPVTDPDDPGTWRYSTIEMGDFDRARSLLGELRALSARGGK
jgi:hypothetical protein